MGMKECFGQLANMSVRFRDSSKQHFLRVDEEKLKECDQCHLFNKCMFVKNNELMREMLKLLDQALQGSSPRIS
jgi:hypothetical protein